MPLIHLILEISKICQIKIKYNETELWCNCYIYKMASLSEIENSSQSQNQDEEVLADKPRMHKHFFAHS